MVKLIFRLESTFFKKVYFMISFKDLTSLLGFVITLVIIEINGADFAPIFFQSIKVKTAFYIIKYLNADLSLLFSGLTEY